MTYLYTQQISIMGYMIGIHDEEKTDQWIPQIWWHYRLRMISAEQMQFPYFRLWPTSKFIQGDPINGASFLTGQDCADGAAFEPWSVFSGGSYRPGYLQGQCTMADGVTPLGSAVVDLYLTSTNQLVSSGLTDPNGYYNLPTPYAAQNHFIYANYNSGLYVGASVNTLTPNF